VTLFAASLGAVSTVFSTFSVTRFLSAELSRTNFESTRWYLRRSANVPAGAT
jgi:hypothetical protein